MGVTAGVAKLVDAPDLGSGAYGVGVQVPPPAPLNQIKCMLYSDLLGLCFFIHPCIHLFIDATRLNVQRARARLRPACKCLEKSD